MKCKIANDHLSLIWHYAAYCNGNNIAYDDNNLEENTKLLRFKSQPEMFLKWQTIRLDT